LEKYKHFPNYQVETVGIFFYFVLIKIVGSVGSIQNSPPVLNILIKKAILLYMHQHLRTLLNMKQKAAFKTQKALGTLPENGNVMLKHVGATIHNY
jgi:hypothetical protein